MKLILLQNLDSVGYKHDVINVKPGYGRNYLIPQGYAVIANPANQEKLDKILADVAAAENAKLDEYKAMATKVAGATLSIGVKSGTSGKIFGKVTNVQVAAVLKDKFDIDIERKKIMLLEDPKEIGTYPAEIHFHPDVKTTIQLELIKE